MPLQPSPHRPALAGTAALSQGAAGQSGGGSGKRAVAAASRGLEPGAWLLWRKGAAGHRDSSRSLPHPPYLEAGLTLISCVSHPLVAQKIVATRKKQQLSIGPCKSLPNSPSHSSVCSAQVSAVHISQVRWGGGGAGKSEPRARGCP